MLHPVFMNKETLLAIDAETSPRNKLLLTDITTRSPQPTVGSEF